jgi:hypothetical protein
VAITENKPVTLYDELSRRRPRSKSISIALVLTVSAFLTYVYVTWLAPNYDYLGFPMHEGGDQIVWLSLFLLVSSALMLPVELRRYSDYFLWMVFYFLYLPAMLYVPLQGMTSDGGLTLVASLALSFATMIWFGQYRIKLPIIRCSRRTFVGVFFVAYVLLSVYVVYTYGGSLHFVQFSDVYDQRELSDEVAGGSLAGYAAGFLAGAFNPFLMAVGLIERRPAWLTIGFLGQLLMYSTAAMKFVLVSALLIPIFYFFLIRPAAITSTRLGVLVGLSCLLPLAAIPLVGGAIDSLGYALVAIVFMRTYGMAGALTGVYSQFFLEHPLTYYSHINIVKLFVPYPYEKSIGQEVGFDMSGGPLNANANFWATDGIAAMGNIGVVAIGLFVAVFLMFCNGVVRPEGRRLAFVATLPFIMEIANASFFTSLFTGGGGLLLFMIYLWQGKGDARHRSRRVAATQS